MNMRQRALTLLEQAVARNARNMGRYAVGTLRNRGLHTTSASEIEEIVADAMLTATQIIRANNGRVPDTAPGMDLWLRKIASFKCLEHLRRTIREREQHEPLHDEFQYLADQQWLDLMELSELRTALNDASGELSDRERQVLEKSILDGETSKDIADSLDITPNMVRKPKRNALLFLRDRLEKLGA